MPSNEWSMTLLFYTASVLNMSFAVFLCIKNFKDNYNVALATIFLAIYAFGCGSERIAFYFFPQYYDFAPRIPWIGTLAIPPYVAFSYRISQNFKYLRIKISILYTLAIAIVLVTLTTSLVVIHETNYTDFTATTPPGPLAIWGRLYLLIGLCVAMFNILKGYRKATGFRKLQLRYFTFGLFIFGMSLIIFVGLIPVLFDTSQSTDWPAIVSVVWLGFTAYAIVRYRLLDIDTVIHRTILWMITSSVIFIPITVMIYFLRPWLAHISWMQLAFLVTVLVYAYLYSYPKVQPRIDHLFRRRKYDYYTVLGEIGQKIGSELDINLVVNRLFNELRDVLYIRNGVILVQQPGQQDYTEAGSIGYENLRAGGKKESPFVSLSYDSPLSHWLGTHQEELEREQVELDPQYAPIKEEALAFFQRNAVELLIPLTVENRVNAMVGIGKKENLRSYTIKDIELLGKLGRQIGITIDNALHHGDIVEKERLAEELRLGREIQMVLLPQHIPQMRGLTVEGLMQPALEIGGDYYDFISLPQQDQFAIVIGDVSGKGVAAGLLMAMAKTAITTISQEETSPRQILLRTNGILNQYMGGHKFMSLLYLIWQPELSSMFYSSAGHEHIFVYRESTQTLEVIQSGGFVLGILPKIDTYLEEWHLKLGSKDKVLLYSDGIIDAENQERDRFGLERLKEAFTRHHQKPAAELIKAVKDEVYAFIGSYPQYDDITLIVMEAA